MTPKEKKALKALDREIGALYTQNCSGIQIDIFDIAKVYAVAYAARAEGRDLKTDIVDFVQTIRKN